MAHPMSDRYRHPLRYTPAYGSVGLGDKVRWGFKAFNKLHEFSSHFPNPRNFPEEKHMAPYNTPPSSSHKRKSHFRPAPSQPFSKRFSPGGLITSNLQRKLAARLVSQTKMKVRNSFSGGRVRAPMRKFRSDGFSKKGITLNYERSNVLGDTRVVTVGHTTACRTHLQVALAHSIVKAMASQMDIPIESFSNQIITSLAGDTFDLHYLTAAGPAPAATGVVVYTVIGNPVTSTWADVASALAAVIEGFSEQVELLTFSFNPVLTGVRTHFISLKNAFFHCQVASSLKMQNRSVPSADAGEDNAEDVHNVPVTGRSYSGMGTGTTRLNPGSTIFTSQVGLWSDDYGVISMAGTSTIAPTPSPSNIIEPEDAGTFVDVKKTGGIHIEPGQIKTSFLFSKINMSVNRYMTLIHTGNLAAAGTRYRARTGKFKFYQLEKLLEPNQGSPYPISIGYENNTRIKTYISFGKGAPTSTVTFNS